MPDFFYSPEARRDLLEIWEFIAQDNLDEADRVEREIQETISRLGSEPTAWSLSSRSDVESGSILVDLLLSDYL
jgi:plasmid stabilization system protein ParE